MKKLTITLVLVVLGGGCAICFSKTLDTASKDFLVMCKSEFNRQEYFGDEVLKENIPICDTSKKSLEILKERLIDWLKEFKCLSVNASQHREKLANLNLFTSTIFAASYDFDLARLHAETTGDLMMFMSYVEHMCDAEMISPDKRYTDYLVYYFIQKNAKQTEFVFSSGSHGVYSSYPPELKLFLRVPSTPESKDFLCRYLFITTNFLHCDFDRLKGNDFRKQYRNSGEGTVNSSNVFEWYFDEIIKPIGLETNFFNIRDEYINRILSATKEGVTQEKGSESAD